MAPADRPRATVFYSWQSDRPNATNRTFIEACLEAAVAELQADASIDVEAVLDRDTAGLPGAPDIVQAILDKIDGAAVFVCDLTLIPPDTGEGDPRRTPNPNVLIELGYAMKSLGVERVLPVVNVAFGGPELLPFDVRQKRLITYSLNSGEPKVEARRKLTATLALALRAILGMTRASTDVATPLANAVDSVRNGKPDVADRVQQFVSWLVDEVANLQFPQKAPTFDKREGLLLASIEATARLILSFDELVRVIASMASVEGVRAVMRAFEMILARYNPPRDVTSFNETDFDLFRFVGQEMFLTLVSALLRAHRPELVVLALSQHLHVEHDRQGRSAMVDFTAIQEHVLLLAERAKRTRKFSEQAELLKQRHDDGRPLAAIKWLELWDADLLLWLRSAPPPDHWGVAWFPHTSFYKGRTPRYLLEATTSVDGARTLMTLLNKPTIKELRDHIAHALAELNKAKGQAGAWTRFDRLDFDPATIREV